MSVGYKISSTIDRFYLLMIANYMLIKVSLELLQSKQNSSIFILFNQQWFVALWTDIQEDESESFEIDEGDQSQKKRLIPYRYKEELCLSLLESSLIIYHEKFDSHLQSQDTTNSQPKQVYDLELLDAWLLSSIEVAEICSKVLDWKVKQSQLGENISQTYLLFLEEISQKIEFMLIQSQESFENELCNKAKEYKRRIQNQMHEIYKRMLDEVSIMGINNDQSNIQLPLIKASCVLLLSKFWNPQQQQKQQNRQVKGQKSEELSFMISLIQQLLNHLCHNKDQALDMSQGVYLLFNSLFHLAFRFEDSLKKTVQELLNQIQTQFDKIAKKAIKEEDVRIIDGILDLIKTIQKYLNQAYFDYEKQALNSFLIESERYQGKISSQNINGSERDIQAFSAGIQLFQKFYFKHQNSREVKGQGKTGSHGLIDNFSMIMRQKMSPGAVNNAVEMKPLKVINQFCEIEELHYRFREAQLITGFGDFVQVYVRYTVKPSNQLVVFHFRVINVTKFLLENLTIEFLHSNNMKIKPYQYQSNRVKIDQISTKDSFNWTVVTVAQSFIGCICQLRITMPPNESCTFDDDIVIYSRDFGTSLLSLLSPDTSCSYSKMKYQISFAQLDHSFSKQCFSQYSPIQIMSLLRTHYSKFCLAFVSDSITLNQLQQKGDPFNELNDTQLLNSSRLDESSIINSSLYDQYSSNLPSSRQSSIIDPTRLGSQPPLEYSYKLGLSAVTWFGDRLFIMFSGLYSNSQAKHSLRVEFRSDNREVIQTVKINCDKIINEIMHGKLIIS
eukprot:403365712